ncbi:hypothetical protein [Hyalangium versicolor]|uniref:hypothetical protein n=1 Tax=Hyalangium versicolor TaxID=2861190 RepID=UPI001CCEF393|nr:hypothetical protein [Hyalangium versicolor]
MKDFQDRRDLACLGLTVLVYGLVVAPVLHAVEGHEGRWEAPAAARGWLDHQRHAEPAHEYSHEHSHEAGRGHEHGHKHGPGKGRPHQHLWGSVEHLQAVAVARAAVLAPVVWWVPLRVEVPRSPEWVSVAPQRRTAMPQGP